MRYQVRDHQTGEQVGFLPFIPKGRVSLGTCKWEPLEVVRLDEIVYIVARFVGPA